LLCGGSPARDIQDSSSHTKPGMAVGIEILKISIRRPAINQHGEAAKRVRWGTKQP